MEKYLEYQHTMATKDDRAQAKWYDTFKSFGKAKSPVPKQKSSN